MSILLDTQLLIWLLAAKRRVSGVVLEAVASGENLVYFSVVNIWEIAIKFALGRQDFPLPPLKALRALRESGLLELAITSEVAASVTDLPNHHRDPFDRLLIAQALAVPARFYTTDRRLAAYSELVTLVR